MKFNPDHTKQTQEIIFSRKKTVSLHPVVYFNNALLNLRATHKHLGMILDSKLSYKNNLQSVFRKVNKTTGLLKIQNFQTTLPIKSLVTIYKSFIRPHLDYGDVFYDRDSIELFHQSLESLQYNASILFVRKEFKNVKSLFLRQKQTFSKILLFLQL